MGAAKAAQILPHTFDVEGFFVSCFRKGAEEASNLCSGDADAQEGRISGKSQGWKGKFFHSWR